MSDGKGSSLSWRVGLSVVVAAICLGVLLFLAGNYHVMEDGYYVHVMFNYARGIEVGAPVLVSGVKVGAVEDVDFIFEENRNRVRLKMWLQKKAVVKEDSKIYVKTLGLMGQPVIEITGGKPASPAVSRGATLEGEEPFVVEEVLAQSRQLVEGLQKSVTIFNSILEDASAKKHIRDAIQNLASASAELDRAIRNNSARIETIAVSIEKTATQMEMLADRGTKDLSPALEDLRASSAELKLLLQNNRPKTDAMMGQLADAAATISKITKDIRAVTEKLNSGKSVASVLLNDETAARSLKITLKNLEDFSGDIKDNPWKLLRKP